MAVNMKFTVFWDEIPCLVDRKKYIVKMTRVGSSGRAVRLQQTTWFHNPENNNLQIMYHSYMLYFSKSEILTPWSRVLLGQVAQMVNKLPAFYGSIMFVTVYLLLVKLIQSRASHHTSFRSILALSPSTYTRGLFSSGLIPIKNRQT